MLFDNAVKFDPIEDFILRVVLALAEVFVAEQSDLSWFIIDTFSDCDDTVNMVAFIARLVLTTTAAKQHLRPCALLTNGTHGLLILLG